MTAFPYSSTQYSNAKKNFKLQHGLPCRNGAGWLYIIALLYHDMHDFLNAFLFLGAV